MRRLAVWLAHLCLIAAALSSAMGDCPPQEQCSLYADGFCGVDTSSDWVYHNFSRDKRNFTAPKFCTQAYSSYRLNQIYDVGIMSPISYFKASVNANGGFTVVTALHQTAVSDVDTPCSDATIFSCLPGNSCHLASRELGLLRGVQDNFDKSAPIKLAMQIIANKTLYWAIYNNDTEILSAKGDNAFDTTLPAKVQPTTVLSCAEESVETCAEYFSLHDPFCTPTCASITDKDICIDRAECMWFNDTACISFASCPFDLNLGPDPCFNPACSFHTLSESETCCDAIQQYCTQNPQDYGCDCEMLSFRCPSLACDSTTVDLPEDLCAAQPYPIVQKSTPCGGNASSVVVEVAANLLENPMCSVLVDSWTGLQCVSEPCLYPPSKIEGKTVTCKLSSHLLALEDTLHVFLVKPGTITQDTTSKCHARLAALEVEQHANYLSRCEPCAPGRARVSAITPDCMVEPSQVITASTSLGHLERAVSCRFWKVSEDGSQLFSPDDWNMPVLSSTAISVTCQTPASYTPGLVTYLTLRVEGYFPSCPRPPILDETGTSDYGGFFTFPIPVTCERCLIEDGATMMGTIIPSPCQLDVCTNVTTLGDYSRACCDSISQFCEMQSCSCATVGAAGCSVANVCELDPASSLAGTCGMHDVAVELNMLEGTILTTIQRLTDAELMAVLQHEVSLLGIPEDHVTCMYSVLGAFRIVSLYVHFATEQSADIFKAAVTGGSYQIFSSVDSFIDSPGTSAKSRSSLVLGISIGAVALVLVVLGVMGAEVTRRHAKRAPVATTFPLQDGASWDAEDASSSPHAKRSKAVSPASDHVLPLQESMSPASMQEVHRIPKPSPSPSQGSQHASPKPNLFYQAAYPADVKEVLGATDLHLAAALGDLESIQTIVDVAAGPTALAVIDGRGQTPLMWACQFAPQTSVALLVTAGSPLDLQDMHGNTALHHACSHANTAATSLLVNAGANLELLNSVGDLPVHCAARQELSQAREMLRVLSTRMPICSAQNRYGVTVLMQCIIEGHDALRTTIITMCSDNPLVLADALARTDRNGMSALHWAARLDDAESTVCLLRSGASPHQVDHLGHTPMDLARLEKSEWAGPLLQAATVPTTATTHVAPPGILGVEPFSSALSDLSAGSIGDSGSISVGDITDGLAGTPSLAATTEEEFNMATEDDFDMAAIALEPLPTQLGGPLASTIDFSQPLTDLELFSELDGLDMSAGAVDLGVDDVNALNALPADLLGPPQAGFVQDPALLIDSASFQLDVQQGQAQASPSATQAASVSSAPVATQSSFMGSSPMSTSDGTASSPKPDAAKPRKRRQRTAEQRARNKENCRLRRIQLKQLDDDLESTVNEVSQQHKLLREILANLKRDRQLLLAQGDDAQNDISVSIV
eukprot:m.359390 g.359390  ORF g.359390 m.359390 type:complete len:1391 (+) comp18552_c0_seq1:358-4530(+)